MLAVGVEVKKKFHMELVALEVEEMAESPALMAQPILEGVVVAVLYQILIPAMAVQVAPASSSSNTLVVPQQALQSSQDRPHGLPRLA
jgi:hypothetical protein